MPNRGRNAFRVQMKAYVTIAKTKLDLDNHNKPATKKITLSLYIFLYINKFI